MLFNSLPFLFVFLPIVLIGFQLLGRFGRNPAIGWLSLSSVVFYGYWNEAFVLLLLGSILFNYACAQAITWAVAKPRWQRMVLFAGVSGNLALLGYYKYWFPLLNSLGTLAHTEHYFGTVILPLGISFFTFTQIGYLIDLQQGEAKSHSLLEHLFFVAFFPHLVAGPILHHREFMPQLKREGKYHLNWEDVAVGSTWFLIGLFKKVVIADQIATAADTLFRDPSGQPFFKVWLGILSYAMQLYFDFSGYSDMAIGLARMFSLRFPINFNSPYKAKNIIEFWQRWHMTLTNYLMLYLYNPIALAVNRRRLAEGKQISRQAVQTMGGFFQIIVTPTLFTMLIAGIWHGAGRTFLAFGLLHGFYICINHAWRTFGSKRLDPAGHHWYKSAASVLLTFLAAVVAQIFFRADSVQDAYAVLAGASGIHGVGPAPHALPSLISWVGIALLLAVVWGMPNTQEILGSYAAEDSPRALIPVDQRRLLWRPNLGWAFLMGIVFLLVFSLMKSNSHFLYFQF
jgi:alginate O-acetyltransferase complex protein AlgI